MKYRGYVLRAGGPHPEGVVQIWFMGELIERTTSIPKAKRIIDDWMYAP